MSFNIPPIVFYSTIFVVPARSFQFHFVGRESTARWARNDFQHVRRLAGENTTVQIDHAVRTVLLASDEASQ